MIAKFFRQLAVRLSVCLFSLPAIAHEPFEITSNARVFADHIRLNVIITDSTAAKLCLTDDSPKLHEKQFAAEHSRIQRCAAELYVVTQGATTLTPSAVQMHLSEEKDLDATITYPIGIDDKLRFEAVHLARLPDPTYGATLTVTSEETFLAQKLLRADDAVLEVSTRINTEAQKRPQASFSEFLRLGIEHILIGYDHLLFLAALLLVCRSVRSALIIITSFTLAHSITLGLAGMGLIELPGRIVEPFIAASIIYVGIENLWRNARAQEPSKRWLITFAFGLVHGFGFASVLREIGLPSEPSALLPPLLAFNLGVEIGQLAIAALVLPLFFYAHRQAWFRRYGTQALSLAISLAGAIWLIERI